MKGADSRQILTVAVLLAGSFASLGARSRTRPATYPDTVLEVRIEGNRFLSDSAVLAQVKTRPGQPYSDELVRADEQRLLKTRRYDNVIATRTQTDKGIIVTFTVVERPLVEAIRFEGNKSLKEKTLRKLLTFAEGDPIDRYRIDSAARAVESKYRSEGFHFAKVTLDRRALREKHQVVLRIVEGPRVAIRRILFKGNRAFPARRLRGIIGSRSRLWIFRAGTLDSETVERDVVDLRNFYRSEGYLDVQVGRHLDFSPDNRSVTLTFVIDEGQHHRIRNVVFEGNTVFPDAELIRDLKLTRGKFYKELTLRRDVETLRRRYGEIGFIDVQVSVATHYVAPTEPVPQWLELPPGTKPALVDLVYKIVESEQYRVGRIDIRGNRVTKDKVIRRQLQFGPGQLYDTVAAEQSRRRLQETGLFEKVSITPYGGGAGVRNALVEVSEAKTAQFLIGAGISSNAGLLGSVSLTERNFDLFAWPRGWSDIAAGRAFKGGGQTLRISAEPGTELMRFRIDWREPYLFDKPYALGASSYVFTSGRETYDESRYGGLLSLGHRFPNRWYAEVAGRIEGVRVDNFSTKVPSDVLDVAGTTALVSVKGTLVRDRTDSRWLPSKGDRISLSYEQVFGDFTFARTRADYHVYYTVYRDALERKHILAGRIAGGAIFGDSPVFERFYGGGLGSIRGFRYRGISPRQGRFAQVVGGDFMTFVGGEYSFPLVARNLRGVVFLDTGTVESDFQVTTYRAAAGVGIRLHVPFFGPVPMSLDFGFPISKDADDDTQLVSFSFGWVF